jgi:hypothetical protein
MSDDERLESATAEFLSKLEQGPETNYWGKPVFHIPKRRQHPLKAFFARRKNHKRDASHLP